MGGLGHLMAASGPHSFRKIVEPPPQSTTKTATRSLLALVLLLPLGKPERLLQGSCFLSLLFGLAQQRNGMLARMHQNVLSALSQVSKQTSQQIPNASAATMCKHKRLQ